MSGITVVLSEGMIKTEAYPLLLFSVFQTSVAGSALWMYLANDQRLTIKLLILSVLAVSKIFKYKVQHVDEATLHYPNKVNKVHKRPYRVHVKSYE